MTSDNVIAFKRTPKKTPSNKFEFPPRPTLNQFDIKEEILTNNLLNIENSLSHVMVDCLDASKEMILARAEYYRGILKTILDDEQSHQRLLDFIHDLAEQAYSHINVNDSSTFYNVYSSGTLAFTSKGVNYRLSLFHSYNTIFLRQLIIVA